jgi:hypothetical protein
MLTVDHGSIGMGALMHSTIASKLGDLTVVVREGAVVGLYFRRHWYHPTRPVLGRAAASASALFATRSAST